MNKTEKESITEGEQNPVQKTSTKFKLAPFENEYNFAWVKFV